MKRISAGWVAAMVTGAFVLAGCGGGDDSGDARGDTSTPAATPSYAESEDCRTKAGSLLDDAESASKSMDADEIDRYALLVESTLDDLLSTEPCSSMYQVEVGDVVKALDDYKAAWRACALLRDDSCGTADQPFVTLDTEVDDARTKLDAKTNG